MSESLPDGGKKMRIQPIHPKMTVLGIAVIAFAFTAVAAMVSWASLSSNDDGIKAYAGMEGNGTIEIRGAVIAMCEPATASVNELVFTLALAEGAEPVNFTMTGDSDADGKLSDETGSTHTVVISYVDANQRADDLTWRYAEYGPGDGDALLEAGENFRITIGADKNGGSDLLANALNPRLGITTAFTIEVRTPNGEALYIERATPDSLNPVTNLN